jgi:hypothetical protein
MYIPHPSLFFGEPPTEMKCTQIISPTDCVKDRLLGYFYWGDKQSLQQALLVAEMNAVDIKEIGRWAEKEGKVSDFNKFIELLA